MATSALPNRDIIVERKGFRGFRRLVIQRTINHINPLTYFKKDRKITVKNRGKTSFQAKKFN